MTDETRGDRSESASGEPLRVGDVLATTFRTIGANQRATLGLTAALLAPTTLLGLALQIVQFYFLRPMYGAGAIVSGLGSFAITIVTTLGTFVLWAVITQITIATLLGRSTTISAAARASLARPLSLIGTAFFTGLLQVVGLFLCLAPGVIAWVWLAVAVPACVAEKIGPIAAVERSIELTEGHRLAILLVGLVLSGALFSLMSCVITPGLVLQMQHVQDVQESLEHGVRITDLQDPLSPLQLMSTAAAMILQILWIPVFSVMPAVIYVRLRGLRESVDTKAVAQVFA